MKRITAVLLIPVLLAALLCACAVMEQQEPTENENFPGTYVYENITMREFTIRTVVIDPDGTYTYNVISTYEDLNGAFTGTWFIDEEGYIILTGDLSGLTSRGRLSADTLLLDIADIDHGKDTVGDGIYKYQFPEDEATPDAVTEAPTEAVTERPTKAAK